MSFIKAADLGKNVLDDYNAAMEAKDMQVKAYYEKMAAQREDMMPPQHISPIRTALTLLDTRLSDLHATVERLFSALRPVTTNTDDNRPGEPAVAREGNSPLNIDINAMADRIGVITVALQLQVDRLEV